MKNSIWVAITFVLMCFLRTESVRGQALEDMEQAEIAKALPQSKFYRENASADAESDDASIAIGIESDNGGLKQGSEVIELTQNLGEERARATTEGDTPDETVEEWDPWEPFNEKTFWLNRQIDRFLLKPVAKGYNAALPDLVRGGIANMFDNLDVTRRLVNNILQLRFDGAGRELARIFLNRTIGIAGFFDVPRSALDLARNEPGNSQTFWQHRNPHGTPLV